MNYYMFYESMDPNAGEFDYDHIVSVMSIESDYDDDLYHDDDVMTIDDHGLWAPLFQPVYYFNATFKEWVGTRRDANAKNGSIYTVPFASDSTTENFGVAQSGVLDTSDAASGPSGLVPVRVDTLDAGGLAPCNFEDPQIGVQSEERPPAMELVLKVTVSGLEAGAAYTLYRYDDEAKVPTSYFNRNASNAVHAWAFVGPADFTLLESIMTDMKAAYRAVRADAS